MTFPYVENDLFYEGLIIRVLHEKNIVVEDRRRMMMHLLCFDYSLRISSTFKSMPFSRLFVTLMHIAKVAYDEARYVTSRLMLGHHAIYKYLFSK